MECDGMKWKKKKRVRNCNSTHKCDDTNDQLMYREGEEGDPELYGNGES